MICRCRLAIVLVHVMHAMAPTATLRSPCTWMCMARDGSMRSCNYTSDMDMQKDTYFCPAAVPRSTIGWRHRASRHHCNRSRSIRADCQTLNVDLASGERHESCSCRSPEAINQVSRTHVAHTSMAMHASEHPLLGRRSFWPGLWSRII